MIISRVESFATEFVALLRAFADQGDDFYPWSQRGFGPEFEIRDGNVLLSDKPGWDLEIEPVWITLADYRVSYYKASS